MYLISHNRSIAELLQPVKKDISLLYHNEFSSMSKEDVSIDELNDAFDTLGYKLNNELTDNEKEFLISFKIGSPKWDLLPLHGVQELPAVKWKMINLAKMAEEDRIKSIDKLKKTLSIQ